MARTGLRTLCLAVRELPREKGLPDGYLEAPPDEDLALCAIVGIKVGCNKHQRALHVNVPHAALLFPKLMGPMCVPKNAGSLAALLLPGCSLPFLLIHPFFPKSSVRLCRECAIPKSKPNPRVGI